jgi:hypothetical protein
MTHALLNAARPVTGFNNVVHCGGFALFHVAVNEKRIVK